MLTSVSTKASTEFDLASLIQQKPNLVHVCLLASHIYCLGAIFTWPIKHKDKKVDAKRKINESIPHNTMGHDFVP